MKLLASILFLVFIPVITFAEIHNVPDQYDVIQEAIDNSADGDTILVEPGEYIGNINFQAKNITVASLYLTTGDESYVIETILDGNDQARVVEIRHEEANEDVAGVLCGFTIQNGSSSYGGGIYCRGTRPTLKNLIIRNNRASRYGGGVYSTTNDAEITANPTLINVTIVGNEAADGGGALRINNGSTITMVNSITWGNEPNELQDEMSITYSDIQGDYNGEGNINSDPRFIDPDQGDYHLTENSPAVDASDPESPPSPDGSRGDMGALSYTHYPEVRVNPVELQFSARVGSQAQRSVTIENIGAVNVNVMSFTIEEDVPYAVEQIEVPILIEPDDEFVLVVTYAPQQVGLHDTILLIETDDPDQEIVEVTLSGTALPQIPVIHIDQDIIDYGDVLLRLNSIHQIIVANNGDATLSVTNISVIGDRADEFRLSIDEFELEADREQTVTVVVVPLEEGEFQATLHIESNDPNNGELDVPLTGTALLPQTHYQFTSNTGVNHTLLLRGASFGNVPLGIGNEIGVFSPDDLCSGGTMWMGEQIGFAAWGDNEITEDVDGLREDEQMTFKIWDYVTEEEYIAIPEFFQNEDINGDEVYHNNGLSVFTLSVEVEEVAGFMVHMTAGWNMISAPIIPNDSTIIGLWQPVVEREHLLILKNGQGRFYVPIHEFNSIPFWDYFTGYQARLSEGDSLFIIGGWVEEDAPLQLHAGWNLIAYFPEAEIDAEIAFESIEDQIIIAKQGNGRFYIPSRGFNGMDDLKRGNGYQVNLTEAVELIWNVPGEAVRQHPNIDNSVSDNSVVTQTGSNMSLLIDKFVGLSGQMEVTLHNEAGLTIGSTILTGDGPYGVVVWGDDQTTDQIDGALDNEPLTVKLWIDNQQIETEVSWMEGDGRYQTDGLSIIELQSDGNAVVATDFNLHDPYPNPFNSTTKLRFSLRENSNVKLSIFNLEGREITRLVEQELLAGQHQISWNADKLPSGIYFAQLKTQYGTYNVKMSLIR